MRITVYFATCNRDIIERIRNDYNIPSGMSVNGETECNLNEDIIELLQSEVVAGYIQLRMKPEKVKPVVQQKNNIENYGIRKRPDRATPCRRSPKSNRARGKNTASSGKGEIRSLF